MVPHRRRANRSTDSRGRSGPATDDFKYARPLPRDMYRAILPTGDIACEDYERQDEGVEVYTDEGEMIAFVPYANLVALVDEDVSLAEDERSTM